MKIAIATDFYSPWIGGPATFVDNFAPYLVSHEHDVHIIAPSATGTPGLERRDGMRIWRVPTIPMPFGYGVRATLRLDRVCEALSAIRPEVVQVHHPFPLGFSAMETARRLGVPVVAVNHTIPECSLYGLREKRLYPVAVSAFRRYLTWFLARAAAICTPTNTAADLLRAMGMSREVEVISNGIDTASFTPPKDRHAARRELGLADLPAVLYTGRLDPEKDMSTWLRAGARALASVNAQLVVGGEGTDKPHLKRLAAELGLGSRVTFPGYLPVDRLPLLYQAADVYFITSAVELQSITTLEAIATGLPVVAARAGALPELVEEEANGFLGPPGDAGRFAEAIVSLLRDPDRAASMGAQSRSRALHHSLTEVARRHEALLCRVAAGNAFLTARA